MCPWPGQLRASVHRPRRLLQHHQVCRLRGSKRAICIIGGRMQAYSSVQGCRCLSTPVPASGPGLLTCVRLDLLQPMHALRASKCLRSWLECGGRASLFLIPS
jgi:hypothetical protein